MQEQLEINASRWLRIKPMAPYITNSHDCITVHRGSMDCDMYEWDSRRI